MTKVVAELLSVKKSRSAYLKRIRIDQISFDDLLDFAINSSDANAWRAAWLVGILVKRNDERITPQISNILNVLLYKGDGHQREVIKILLRMDLNEMQQSIFFDYCITIWKSIEKKSSTRICAFKFLVKMQKNIPELAGEVRYLNQEIYTESLSVGIKKSLEKMQLL